RLQNYGLAVASTILAMLPFSYHFLIGIVVGPWALWVLSRPEVKTAFIMNLRHRLHAGNRPLRKPTGPIRGWLRSAFHSVLTLIVHRSRPATSVSAPASEPRPRPAASNQERAIPAWAVVAVVGIVAVTLGLSILLLHGASEKTLDVGKGGGPG